MLEQTSSERVDARVEFANVARMITESELSGWSQCAGPRRGGPAGWQNVLSRREEVR